MTLSSFRAKRRLAVWIQAALVLGIPFIRSGGESAFRFDVPSLKLFFFGSVLWISEAYFFLLVFLLFFIGIMLFTVLYGRIWCGWACPQTVLSDLARSIEKLSARFARHPVIRTAISHVLLVLFSALVSASLIWYFVSPYEMFSDIAALSLGPWTFWSWVVFASLVYLDLAFVRQRFCGAVCPYARMQSAFFDDRTRTIAFDRSRTEECSKCEACVRICPADIDIRQGLQVECINCAECIDACAESMKRHGKKPLVGYARGKGGVAQAGPRPRVIGLSLAFGVFAALLAYQIYMRIPVDFAVFRDETQTYHQVSVRGKMMNAYSLFIENRSLQPESYHLGIAGIRDAELVVSPNPVTLPPNSVVKMRVYVFAMRSNLVDRVTRLRFTLEHTTIQELRMTRETSFIYSDRTDKGWEI
ncbi:MAG TPA: 4Fe-4S dicluster domain-containing protein [Nitrospirota bacterium]